MRFKLYGWVSAAHWNGSVFRVGETGDGVEDSLTEEEEDLRVASAAKEADEIHNEFSDMVTRVEQVCMPRMKAREAQILERNTEKLRKNFELQTEQ